MSRLQIIPILIVAYLAVFLECSFTGLRNVLGCQIDLLPAIMVYTSLFAGLTAVTLLAIVGGLAFDSLSGNPMGISVLPLFVVGALLHRRRGLILKEEVLAQVVLGAGASAVVPVFSLVLLCAVGQSPILGWHSLGQWLVLIGAGGALTPAVFGAFGLLRRTFLHPRAGETTFRSDREIIRGRF